MKWQSIDTLRLWENVTVWLNTYDNDGFAMTGHIHATEPLCIIQDDGSYFWPHENGSWASHWIENPVVPDTPK